jgi:arylsulfatase A-like enzyme
VGRIAGAVEDEGLSENTLLLFLADNGTHSDLWSMMGTDTIFGGKALTTDNGVHVPLIAYWKGTIPSGSINDDLIDLTDFAPTLADALQQKLPLSEIFDGHSFYNAMLLKEKKPRDFVFGHYDPGSNYAESHLSRYAHDKEWKLYDDGRFYNFANDKSEETPLINEQLDDDVQQIRLRLKHVLDSLK